MTAMLDGFFLATDMYGTKDDNTYPTEWLVCVILLVFTTTIALCMCGLSIYHCKLAFNGETTNEEVRGKYIGGNVFDEGYR